MAEQYRKTKLFIQTKPSGERVIVDPMLTASRIYMYFYLFINIGALVGQIGMTYSEKFVGFWLAYLLPTLVFCSAPLVLWIGRNRYVRSPPAGSVLGQALRLWRHAAKGRWSANPAKMYRAFRSDDFWESAKPSRVQAVEGTKPSWMTFDDQWVDEVRRGFKACEVFVWFPLYCALYCLTSESSLIDASICRADVQPDQQQPDFAGGDDGDEWPPERCPVESRSVCPHHPHSHLRHVHLPSHAAGRHQLHTVSNTSLLQ